MWKEGAASSDLSGHSHWSLPGCLLAAPITLVVTRFSFGYSTLALGGITCTRTVVDQVENKSHRRLQTIASKQKQRKIYTRSTYKKRSSPYDFPSVNDVDSVFRWQIMLLRYTQSDTQPIWHDNQAPVNKLQTGIHGYVYDPTCTFSHSGHRTW